MRLLGQAHHPAGSLEEQRQQEEARRFLQRLTWRGVRWAVVAAVALGCVQAFLPDAPGAGLRREAFLLSSLIFLVISFAASFAISMLLNPSSNSDQAEPDPATLEEWDIPTVAEDRPLAIYYGSIKAAFAIIMAGELDVQDIEADVPGSDPTIGFGYRLPYLGAIGGKIEQLVQVWRNDRLEPFFTGAGPEAAIAAGAHWGGFSVPALTQHLTGSPTITVARSSGNTTATLSVAQPTAARGDHIIYLDANGDPVTIWILEVVSTTKFKVRKCLDAFTLKHRKSRNIGLWGKDTLADKETTPRTVVGIRNPGLWMMCGERSKTEPSEDAVHSFATLRDGDDSYADHTFQKATGERMIFPGTSMICFENAFAGDNVRSLDPVSVVVRRVNFLGGGAWTNAAINEVSGGGPWHGDADNGTVDANPAHVIYDILVNVLGVSAGDVDATTFQSVGDTLATENLGISLSITRQKTVKQVLDDILRHIDGFLFRSASTGKWTMRLMREDYGPIAALTEVNVEDDCESFEISRRAWTSVNTGINVKYTSRERWDNRVAFIENLGGTSVVGHENTKSISLPYLTHPDAVKGVVQRLKLRYFFPLATVRMTVATDVLNPELGDVFKATSSQMGGGGFSDLVLRVVGISGLSQKSNQVTLECIEDMFAVGTIDAVDLPQEGAGDPVSLIITEQVRHARVMDCPQFSWPCRKSIMTFACRPSSDSSPFYIVRVNEPSISDEDPGIFHNVRLPYNARAECDLTGYPDTTADVDRSVGFTVDTVIDLAETVVSEADWQAGRGCQYILDNGGDSWELIFVRSVIDNDDGTFTFTDIIRDVGGSGKQNCNGGTAVWRVNRNPVEHPRRFTNSIQSVEGRDVNAALSVKFYAANSHDIGPSASVSHTYGWRPETPHAVQQLQLRTIDVTSPPAPGSGNEVELTWVARRRGGGFGINVMDDEATVMEDEAEGVFTIEGADLFEDVHSGLAPEQMLFYRSGTPASTTYTVKNRVEGRPSAGVNVTGGY